MTAVSRALTNSEVALLAIQTRVEELREVDARLAIASVARADAIDSAEAAERAREQAEQELSVAEAAQRRAASDEGAHERALQQARLETELAELKSREHELMATKTCVERLIAATEKLDAVREVRRQCMADLDAGRAVERDAGEAARAAEQGLATSRLIVAYGKWRTAADAAANAAKAFQEVEGLHLQATAKDSEAAGLESGERLLLPPQDQFKKMRLLARDLGNAEAALGGGITITIRAKEPISLTSTLDGAPSQPQFIDSAVELDAERSARLELANLVEIDVQAGAPDKRTVAGHLRARWEMEVVPVLLRAGVIDLDELERMLSEADSARLRALQLRADAQSLRGRASHHEARATELASTAKQVAAREQALGVANRAELEKAFEAMGADWEQEIERAEADNQNVADLARQRNSAAAQLVATAVYRLDDAEKRCERLAVALDDARSSAPARADANVWLEEITGALASVAAERRRLEQVRSAVEAEVGLQVSAADRALLASQKALVVATSREAETAMWRDAARSAYDTLAGQCETLRSQVAALDLTAAEKLYATREREVAVLPVVAPAADTDVAVAEKALEAAERALREVAEELLTADGGLQKVGGAVLRDNLLRVKEAVDAARARERSLQLEADSWQLLRDVLREVENQEGTHLGRALAVPVTGRLRGLTSSRYGDLQLGPGLDAQGIGGVSGASPESVLAALSVGTKDQLATLLRMAIAQELRAPIVLDDHLVHTDPQRQEWFRKALRETAATTQVIVLTCRPRDYLALEEMPSEDAANKHLAGGAIHVMNLERVIRRYATSLEATTPRVASS